MEQNLSPSLAPFGAYLPMARLAAAVTPTLGRSVRTVRRIIIQRLPRAATRAHLTLDPASYLDRHIAIVFRRGATTEPALYTRVSTRDKGQDTANQLDQ